MKPQPIIPRRIYDSDYEEDNDFERDLDEENLNKLGDKEKSSGEKQPKKKGVRQKEYSGNY